MQFSLFPSPPWAFDPCRPIRRRVPRRRVPPCATSSRMVAMVAPSNGATLPVLVDGCHGVMRPEEGAHVAHRQRNLLLGGLPGIEAHLGVRREMHTLHSHGVWVRRNVVR